MIGPRVRLQLRRIIGEGEQGRVYEAVRLDPATNLRQTVAVKILHSRNAVDLWRKEFGSLAEIRSKYCVRVLSFERVRGRPALILEHVRGLALTEWQRAQLGTADDRREIVAQVLAGLRDLRDQGGYHGDLSPNNVMVDDRGCIRLLDFGLANGHGENLRCTPEFAAPERLRGVPPDHEADLFSLGRLTQFLGEVPEPAWLDDEPRLRSVSGPEPEPRRAAALAMTVNAYLNGAGRAPRWVTETFKRTSAPLLARVATLAVMWVTLCLRASPSVARPGFATLIVRTRAWHELRIDGQVVGFAPLVVPVTSDRAHDVSWTSARGAGVVRVKLRAGDSRRLTDRDFAH